MREIVMSTRGVTNAKLKREPFSVPRLAARGVTLAAVTLIAFVGARILLPQDSLAVGGGGISPSRTATPAVDPPVEPTPMAAAQPTEPRNSTTSSARLFAILFDDDAARVRPRDPKRETPSAHRAERKPLNSSDAAAIQTRLRDLGYYFGTVGDVWGAAARRALHDFKSLNGMLDDDKWDRETEERLSSRTAAYTFIGRWVPDSEVCRRREGSDQLVINARGAKTARGKCDFRSVKQEAAKQGAARSWRVYAICSTAAGNLWSTDIDLTMIGPNLRWSSARGSETYVRCARR